MRRSEKRLDVDLSSGRTSVSPGGTTEIATGADRSRFERQLLSTLVHGAPFAIPPDRPDATLTLTSAGCTYTGAKQVTAGPIILDTVNRTSTPFAWAIGHLDGTHTLTDLKHYAARLKGAPTAPKWFSGDANGAPVPPHTRLTWQAAIPALADRLDHLRLRDGRTDTHLASRGRARLRIPLTPPCGSSDTTRRVCSYRLRVREPGARLQH